MIPKIEDLEITMICSNDSQWFKTYKGVKILHKPSGISADHTEGRGSHYNKSKAYEKLCKKLDTWTPSESVSEYVPVPTSIHPTYHPEFESVVNSLRQPPKVLKDQDANEYYNMWWEALLKAVKDSK